MSQGTLGIILAFVAVMSSVQAEETGGSFESVHVTRAGIPLRIIGDQWRVEVPAIREGNFRIPFAGEPLSVQCADNGEALSVSNTSEVLEIAFPEGRYCGVVQIFWPQNKWEPVIERLSKVTRPARSILFTGSSTIAMWPLEASFPGLPVVNFGFGGSQYSDLLRFVDRLLEKSLSHTLVLYSGDNDIASGKSPEWVFADFEAFLDYICNHDKRTNIVILGIKASASRWDKHPLMDRTNRLFEAYAQERENVLFLDLGHLLLDSNGMPDPVCYRQDQLHLSDEGYRRWSAALMPVLSVCNDTGHLPE